MKRPDPSPRPRLGRRVVRGIEALLRPRDGNLLVATETARTASRRDYERAVRYLERLVTWVRERRRG